MKINILGVQINKITLEDTVREIEQWLKTGGKHYIVTPNIEFIILAQKDSEFRKILNKSDLSIPDSARIGWSYKEVTQKSIFKRLLLWPLFIFPRQFTSDFPVTTGTDLMGKLVEVSADKGYTIGLLGGGEESAKKLVTNLKKRYPKLKIGLAESTVVINKNGEIIEGGQQLNQLELKLDILFVAFGQGKQEKWIYANLDEIPAKVMIGVGGAFDYLSGEVLRAPKWVRNLGFEWLFRLVIQPWRIKRFGALVQFVFLVLRG